MPPELHERLSYRCGGAQPGFQPATPVVGQVISRPSGQVGGHVVDNESRLWPGREQHACWIRAYDRRDADTASCP